MLSKLPSSGIKKIARIPSKSKKSSQKKKPSQATLLEAATQSSDSPIPNPNSPIYFWKPHDNNGYLSQWYESPWTHDGATYATAEMWMMVDKARLFGDEEIAQRMLKTTDPKEHKRLGRLVKGFDDKIWNKERMRIVEEGSWWKFTESEGAGELKKWLLETGDRELVEASPMDRIWGIGFGEKNAEKNRYKWGKNLPGKALMNVRDRLKEEEEAKEISE